jgi:hypothetical protein
VLLVVECFSLWLLNKVLMLLLVLVCLLCVVVAAVLAVGLVGLVLTLTLTLIFFGCWLQSGGCSLSWCCGLSLAVVVVTAGWVVDVLVVGVVVFTVVGAVVVVSVVVVFWDWFVVAADGFAPSAFALTSASAVVVCVAVTVCCC